MRVAIVTPWFPTDDLPTSGVFVLRDALALAAEHDVRVVHLDAQARSGKPATRVEDGIPVLHVPFDRRRPSHWLRAKGLVAQAAADADIVHTHALPGIMPFALRRPAGKTPWVHTEHWSGITTPSIQSLGVRVTRLALLPLLRRPDVVVTVCTRLGDGIRPHRGGPIRIIPCIVDAPAAVVSAPREETLRLVGVGRITPAKGSMLALETVAELDRRGVRATLTWVGEGPERGALISRAAELGITDRLNLTGTLDAAGVGQALDASDLFILPTMGDNFCVSVAEALLHGRPIVSGADTGAVDYTDVTVGRFVTERTPTAYADAVTDLWRATKNMTASEIAATMTARCSPAEVASQLDDLYHELLASNQTPTATTTDARLASAQQ